MVEMLAVEAVWLSAERCGAWRFIPELTWGEHKVGGGKGGGVGEVGAGKWWLGVVELLGRVMVGDIVE